MIYPDLWLGIQGMCNEVFSRNDFGKDLTGYPSASLLHILQYLIGSLTPQSSLTPKAARANIYIKHAILHV